MRLLGIILAIVIALVAVSHGLAQSGGAHVAFAPASSTAAAGASVAVDVTVANVAASPGLGGYTISMSFNPAVVRLASFADSGFVTSGQLIVICGPAQIDNVAGTAQAMCTPIQIFGAPGMSTSSPVALLHASFTALAPGTSPLSLDGSTLKDPTGATIAATFGSGAITVSAPAQDAPSPQPTATAEAATAPQVSVTVPRSASPPPVSAVSGATVVAPNPATPLAAGAPLHPPTTGTGGGEAGAPRLLWATIIAATLASLLLLGAGSALMLRLRSRR